MTGNVRTLTLNEVRADLAALTADVEARGYTLNEFKTRGQQWELGADDRGTLADIEAYEFFLRRAEGLGTA